jgi:glycogen synthase
MVKGIQPDYKLPHQDARHKKLFDTLLRDLIMAGTLRDADVVHCHTWYSHFAGCLLKQLLGVPLILSTHSLEPRRPWKEEQLGSGYKVSSWLEKTAYENADGIIAVSTAMRQDVHDIYGVPFEKIRVIYNGIDLNQYQPTPNLNVLAHYKIDPEKPFVLFVGRITRQKGIIHLVNAIKYLRPGLQVVLCAGAPDTEEIGKEMEEKVEQARAATKNEIIWIPEIVPKDRIISLYTHAAVFVCPSVYEPFGIINLEAMACATPVVASAVGGIQEVVVPDKTGLLVPFEPKGNGDLEPRNPDRFARDLANAVNLLLSQPKKIEEMGVRSRERVEHFFGWPSIARFTLDFYWVLVQA